MSAQWPEKPGYSRGAPHAVGFTFFFRDQQVLQTAVGHLAPAIAGRSRAKIWDAGCSVGAEAYTLAILLAGQLGPFAFRNVRITASDLDETRQFEAIVREGVYARSELTRMPPGILERYFEDTDSAGSCRVRDEIRASVGFTRHDLLSLNEIGTGFSLVVCKNVLLHFSYAQRVDVIRMFHRSLASGGYFVTEHTQKMPPEAAEGFEQVLPHVQLFRKVETRRCA